MQTDQYVITVNQKLERLLVFETVFKEFFHTCLNIEKGNCYASESLAQLRTYFSKNVISFNRFVDETARLCAPRGYQKFNQILIGSLAKIGTGVAMSLMAIEGNGVDHRLFETGIAQAEAARAAIDAAFDTIRPVPA